jgi:DNA-binding transcriptional regulator LsrR (DeoR family)
MAKTSRPTKERKLEQAARAAWLYYIAGNDQSEVAAKLQISRHATQRLVAMAVREKLIKFRIEHNSVECIELAEKLREKFALTFSDVAPHYPSLADTEIAIAGLAAAKIEALLTPKSPVTISIGTGRTLRAAVDEVKSLERPDHKVVSMVGNVTRDGRASGYDVAMRLAERIGAQCYPLLTPVLANSSEERELLRSQRGFQAVHDLVEQSKVSFLGLGEVGSQAPIYKDRFVTRDELDELISSGTVGEIIGWAFNEEGTIYPKGTNVRVASIPLEVPPKRLTIAVAGGSAKHGAIAAALRGRLITGLITDEDTARVLLQAK